MGLLNSKHLIEMGFMGKCEFAILKDFIQLIYSEAILEKLFKQIKNI